MAYNPITDNARDNIRGYTYGVWCSRCQERRGHRTAENCSAAQLCRYIRCMCRNVSSMVLTSWRMPPNGANRTLNCLRRPWNCVGLSMITATMIREFVGYMDSLKTSVLAAFYTPAPVVDTISDALKNSGIEVRSFLEPSAGQRAFIDSFSPNDKIPARRCWRMIEDFAYGQESCRHCILRF